MATFCLLNETTLPIVDAGKSMPRLIYKYGDCRVRDPEDPAHFIAHPESWVRKLYRDAGLEIVGAHREGDVGQTSPPRRSRTRSTD